MWPFRNYKPLTSIPDEWHVATTDIGGALHVLHQAAWAWPLRGHPEYPWRIGIAAPIPEDCDPASVLEPDSPYVRLDDRATSILQANFDSLKVLMIRASSFRELVFYTRDAERARPKLDAICAEFADIQAAYIIEPDPKWHTFTRF